MQECLVAFYEYPDEMHELIDCITQFELDYAAELCKYVKPDALFHHDDWGSQISTFLSPDMFREFIKPAFMKIYGYYKSHGVQLIAHHSDSYAATLVPDMIDMGIDIWQGVMTSNDIPALIRQYGGKISFMGGIDSAKVDYEGWTKKVVQAEVDRACAECGTLYFIPNASQGLPMSTFPASMRRLTRPSTAQAGAISRSHKKKEDKKMIIIGEKINGSIPVVADAHCAARHGFHPAARHCPDQGGRNVY